MRTRICKEWGFSASHQLTNLEDGHPCARLHGHNYQVSVILEGRVSKITGMIVDFRELSRPIKDYINTHLDHRHLNDIIPQPTSELLAHHLFGIFSEMANFPCWKVVSVRVSETGSTWAEVLL